MGSVLKIFSILCLVLSSCSPKPSAESELQLKPTETTTPTSTLTPTPTSEQFPTLAPWEFIEFSILNDSNNWNESPLPYEENGNWNIEKGENKITISVFDQGGVNNRVRLSVAGKKEYEILVSKGAILFLFISDDSHWADHYLFSPDIGSKGNFVDCIMYDTSKSCFWPPSLVQIDILLWGDIYVHKYIEEANGWCRKLVNIPLTKGEGILIPINIYKLPLSGYVVNWSEECPESEITEITQ